MSYCRFENTLTDLKDCEEALADIEGLDQLSDDEHLAAFKLITLCAKIVEEHKHLQKRSLKDEDYKDLLAGCTPAR
jgi:hypothetical protein